jgi:3-isopropylmalate/(R)-2-methylmalate dehydratase small subunit
MKPFTIHTGLVASLQRANVDTDAIIPKQFLKSISRTGFGPNLFFDWRYRQDGSPDPDFELNHPRFEGRSILITGNNFGCGSSREHAVWALVQDGYRVIIAPWRMDGDERLPGFADIFCNNAVKNGLLTVELSEAEVDEMRNEIQTRGRLEATIDLSRQEVVLNTPEKKTYHFEIDAGVKDQLIKGLDDIDTTLQYEDLIDRFEKDHLPSLG